MTEMTKFFRKFYGRMLIFAGIFAALGTMLLQTTFDRVKIEHDRSAAVWFIVLPLIYAGALSAFTFAMAKHHTNVLRRYEYGVNGRERTFYAVFAVVVIAVSAGEIGFLIWKLLPFLDKALTFAIKDAEIKNETLSMRQEIIDKLNVRYSTYRTAAFIGAGSSFAVKAVGAVLSAPRLVKEYRDPPDYWSGKKKKRRKE